MPIWSALIPGALWGIDSLTGGGLSGNSAISNATNQMSGGINQATGNIQDATNKALAYNAPYLNPEVFKKMSDLIQSGAFQKPFNKSFQAYNWQTPGMQFNPSQGKMSMTPWQANRPPPSFTPQGLPPGMTGIAPQMAPPQPQISQVPNNGIPGINPIQAMLAALSSGQKLAPIEMPKAPGLTMPQDVMKTYKPFNPLTDKYPLGFGGQRGSGPIMPTMGKI